MTAPGGLMTDLIDEIEGLNEAPRKRRTAYRSGRLELIGYKKPRFRKPKRKVSPEGKRKLRSPITGTPMKGKFRWKKG
jgi:hypothetical protein